MPATSAATCIPRNMDPRRSFQGLILALQRYWADHGCVILQPYDMEVGAGTFHPATTLRALGPKPWNAAYVQPSRRPKDGRYGENPNRLQHYYQFQVILKPSPPDLQDLYLNSLYAIGIDPKLHDIRFVEDDWESPTLGAWGLGWECWCDGMEVSQFTYFQQVAGFECAPVSGELTYGLERLAMYVQGVDNVYDLNFNGREGNEKVTYGDVFLQAEQEYSRYNFEFADTEMLFEHFKMAEAACRNISPRAGKAAREERHLMALPAYDQCIKASHVFNLLDARGVISVTERQSYILRVRESGQGLRRGLAGDSRRGRSESAGRHRRRWRESARRSERGRATAVPQCVAVSPCFFAPPAGPSTSASAAAAARRARAVITHGRGRAIRGLAGGERRDRIRPRHGGEIRRAQEASTWLLAPAGERCSPSRSSRSPCSALQDRLKDLVSGYGMALRVGFTAEETRSEQALEAVDFASPVGREVAARE